MRRLLATAGSWFLWDFSFYGNKVFQSQFIMILSPKASLFTNIAWTLLNSGATPARCSCCSLQSSSCACRAQQPWTTVGDQPAEIHLEQQPQHGQQLQLSAPGRQVLRAAAPGRQVLQALQPLLQAAPLWATRLQQGWRQQHSASACRIILQEVASHASAAAGCALVGYYVSAFTVDSKYVGRIRIQLLGFAMVGALFFVSAIWYKDLIKPGGIHVFQFIYFFSSFWGQWGPNCTTFLLAGARPTDCGPCAASWCMLVQLLGAHEHPGQLCTAHLQLPQCSQWTQEHTAV